MFHLLCKIVKSWEPAWDQDLNPAPLPLPLCIRCYLISKCIHLKPYCYLLSRLSVSFCPCQRSVSALLKHSSKNQRHGECGSKLVSFSEYCVISICTGIMWVQYDYYPIYLIIVLYFSVVLVPCQSFTSIVVLQQIIRVIHNSTHCIRIPSSARSMKD